MDTPVLRGTQVVLRALTDGDAAALAEASAESRANYLYNPVPEGLAGAHAYIAKAFDQQRAGFRMPFVIELQSRVVGTTSYSELEPWRWPEGSRLQRSATPDAVEVGYTWLAHSAQRTRVNTEAKIGRVRGNINGVLNAVSLISYGGAAFVQETAVGETLAWIGALVAVATAVQLALVFRVPASARS